MEEDTKKLIPLRKTDPEDGGFDGGERDDSGTSVSERINDLLDRAGKPFEPIAQGWLDKRLLRDALRTDENRLAVREANAALIEANRTVRRDAKQYEQARDEVSRLNWFNRERRAAWQTLRDSKREARSARTDYRDAKRNYPWPLRRVAATCHASHAVPAFVWQSVSDSWVATGGFVTSVTVVAFHVTAVTLGMRHAVTPVAETVTGALQPSQAEAEMLRRLDPVKWVHVAGERGLGDVIPSGATLGESGITAKLTLQGQMDTHRLRGMEAQLRATLRVPRGVRVEIREGETGGYAKLVLRSRSAADGKKLTGWNSEASWAVDTVTGEDVPVPLGRRLLFAGTSGSGKSWSARPLMAEASERDDHRLVILDRKYIEGKNWEHRARQAAELDDIRQVLEELCEEGEERLKAIPRGRDTVEISPWLPRITVFVDEGGELISDSKTKYKDEDGKVADYGDIMTMLRTIARKYRAAEIILVWCTQKPSLSGEGHGLDSQISGQIVHRLSLALSTATDSQVVYGSDANEKGWKAHELPMPGVALFRDQELGPKSVPNPIRMRAMSPADVMALPDRPIWRRERVPGGRASERDVEIRKGLEAAPVDDVTETEPTRRVPVTDRVDLLLEALSEDPCQTLSQLAQATGLHRETVRRALTLMEDDGLVTKDADGCWSPVG